MRLLSVLKDLAVKIEKKNNSMFSYDVNKQDEYISSFSNPSDDIERSYFQYKCQMKMYGIPTTIILDLASLVIYGAISIKTNKNKEVKSFEHYDAVFFRDGKPANILPTSLVQEFTHINMDSVEDAVCDKEDREFFSEIKKRYPLSWHFWLKCYIKMTKYSFAIKTYSPKAIICCSEYSFTSSFMTQYCASKNVELINVMHGEKVFFMRDAFFRFNRCYVWNDYYVKLLSSLKAEKTQFIVELPPSMQFLHERKFVVKKCVDFTYYLAAESNEELIIIKNALEKILNNKNNTSIAVRPHPRYTNIEFANDLFKQFMIEDVNAITIEESILRTKNAIAVYSTVLNQAYNNGTNIVIDDISSPFRYNKLHAVKYIFADTNAQKLSDLVERK